MDHERPGPELKSASSGSARSVERPAGAPFVIYDTPVEGGASAMVIQPVAPMVVDRARLARVGGSSTLSPVEQWMVAEAQRRGAGARLLLFRGVLEDGRRGWEFDESFTDAELEEGGRIMTTALLPLHRELVRNGAILMVHTEWGSREVIAMRRGVESAARVVDASQSATREIDLWILRNMLMHFSLAFDHVVETLLPNHLRLIERRIERVRRLLDSVHGER